MGTKVRKSNGVEVDRAAARTAEEDYFERLGASMAATAGIFDPLSNRTYDSSIKNRITRELDDRSAELKGYIKRYAERDLMGTYEDMPKNRVVLHEIVHKELLGRPSTRVIIAAASFSPSEELVKHGRSCRRGTAVELERVRESLVKNESVFYYLGAFSTTGWDEDAKTSIAGPNWLIALSDRADGAWRTWYAPDPRWRAAARIFDLSTEEEKVEAVRRWVGRHTGELLLDELTEDRVFDDLGYALPIVREAFRRIAAEDRYVKFDTSARPYRLTRTYG